MLCDRKNRYIACGTKTFSKFGKQIPKTAYKNCLYVILKVHYVGITHMNAPLLPLLFQACVRMLILWPSGV